MCPVRVEWRVRRLRSSSAIALETNHHGNVMTGSIDRIMLLRYQISDLARGVLYAYFFRPAAYVLPTRVLSYMASFLALLLVLLDRFGRTAREDYGRILGVSWARGLKFHWRQQANLLFEHAWLHRVIAGRARPEDYEIRIEASRAVMDTLKGSGSFVVGSGHFMRGPATLLMTVPTIVPHPSFVASVDPSPKPHNLHEWRIRLQLSAALNALPKWSPPGWVQVLFLGKALARAVSAIRSDQGALFFANIDAHWQKNHGPTVTTPYAGFASRAFSTGAARIARLGGCPLLLMIPFPLKGRVATVKMLGPYESSCALDEEADADRMRQMLRDLERAVGEQPEQYALDFGRERCWDEKHKAWVAMEDTGRRC